jgi:hypothetical protein
LENEVRDQQTEGNPVVLFEEDDRRDKLPDYVKRLGITGEQVFVVLTKKNSPDPLDGQFIEFAFGLQGVGLNQASIVGARLIDNRKDGTEAYFGKRYDGCVAKTVDNLNKVGVTASFGKSIQD